MASATRNKPTTSKAEKEALSDSEVDRLSNLPDSLLHHILSYTDTKYALRLSLLSTRFNDLCTSLPNLNLDTRSFQTPHSFNKFVVRLLSRRERHSDVISIRYHQGGVFDPSPPMVRTVKYALLYNIQHLNITSYSSTQINPKLFTSPSLKTLRIVSYTKLPSSFDMPNLTTLHLENISIDQTTLCFSGCLKMNCLQLSINNGYQECFETLRIICPRQLENLTFSDKYLLVRKSVMITAPKLTYFNFRGNLGTRFSGDGLASLEQADIDGVLFNYHASPGEGTDIINLLSQFSNAKFVTLASGIVKVLSEFPDLVEHLPSPFTNLKSLKLIASKRYINSKGLDKVIAYLLNSSPGAAVVVRPL